ncbi:MAG: thrombospondin type 3 repeat-containing protein [Dehalococcoidia bacterium]
MHLPVPYKAGLLGLSALFALVAALAVFLNSGGGTAEAATYAPTSKARFCNTLAADFPSSIGPNDADLAGDPACVQGAIPANTARDFTVTFSVAGGHSNFGSSVITNAGGTTSADAAIPNGEKVGGLRSDVTLSLLNGACATALVAEFVLYDTATAGVLAVNPEGTADRWNAAGADIITDANLDGIADSTSPFVGSSPSVYHDLFTPTGAAEVVPLARYTGATRVPSNGDWQLLSFFQVTASSLSAFSDPADDAGHIFGRVGGAGTSGVVSLSILNDPTAVQIAISPIHDFCAPLIVQTMLLGETPGGQTRYLTPAAAGTMAISNYSYGQRDADDDGKENAFDPCPFDAAQVDTDSDGIPDVCDPTDAVNTGLGDHDSDGFQNRQDNCPIVPNGLPNQLDSEVGEDYVDAALDGGPLGDSIGDQCDPNPLTSNLEGGFVESYNYTNPASDGTVFCIGGVDADNDGYCAPQDLNDGSAAAKGFATNNGMDVEYKLGATIGDNVGGNLEIWLGTSPLLRCAFGAGTSPAWPFDLVMGAGPGATSINIQDVLAVKPFIGGAFPASQRYDFVPSKTINIQDVLAIKPEIGKNCTP